MKATAGLHLRGGPPHAVANPAQILARLWLAENKQVLVHDQVKLVAAGFASPAAGVLAVVLGMEK